MKAMNKTSLWKVFAIMLVMALSWANGAGADDAAAIIEQADKLADDENYEDANKLLMDLARSNPDHPDVYWKISQNLYDMGERVDIEQDKDRKLDLYVKAEEWAKKGYDRNPGLADNAFWMAVGMSQQAQTKGIASTLLSDRTLAGRIEEFYIKSTQAKDFHYKEENSDTISSAHFALGQFYRKVPSGWYIKMIMGTAGDIDKSVEHARKAVDMYPKNLENNKELGVALICRGNKNDNQKDIEEGKKWLNKTLALPAEGTIDKIDHADCKELLADLSLACGYSRVQQEEVSEDQFKDEK